MLHEVDSLPHDVAVDEHVWITVSDGTRLAGQDDRLAEADWDTIGRLEAFAAERDLRMIDVAIGGLAAQPVVASVIAGATKPEQVEANVKAAEWKLTPEEMADVDKISSHE